MNLDNYDLISKRDGLNELGFQEIKLNNDINHNCSYLEIEDFQNKIKTKGEVFSTFSLNIRSLQNKMSELQDLIDNLSSDTFSFSVLCIQEIWNVPNAQLVLLENFHPMAMKTRTLKKGGGVGTFISKQFQFESLNELNTVNDQYEALFLKVFKDKKEFKIVCNIYRPPNGDLKQFIEFLADRLYTLTTDSNYKKANEIILCADFNVNFMNFDNHTLTNDLLNTLISHGFLPMITLPTRITERSATLIDNIFTNKKQSFYDSGLILSSISDHLPVFYLNTACHKNKPEERKVFHDISPQNLNSFKEKLSNENWTNVTQMDQPKQAFDNFSNILECHFLESFPLKEKKKNKRYNPIKPWMTHDILTSLRKKHRKLLKEKFKKRTVEAKEKFDEINKIYSNEIRKAKKLYYDAQFKTFSNDMKKTWSLINTVIKKQRAKNDVPKVFHDEHRTYNSFSEIAQGFNDFFINVGPRLASSIPDSINSFESYLGDPHNIDFSFRNITEDIVYKTLSNLKSKSSVGKDKISMSLLKEIMPMIISPIVHLFNLSLNTGFIPDIYKCARVIPIYKSGPPDQFDNYRPISLLPALSKVLEKIVAFQMIKFLESQNIFYAHQYGFRKNRDTQQPLVQLLNKVYEGLNKSTSEYTLSIFLDLRKAFDTCDINILIRKLNHYGFRGTPLKWFKNYLTGRKQYVEIEGFKSNEKVITHGVPQGSVLGPILFLLYINDFPQATDLYSSLFADDTMLTKSMSNVDNLNDIANNELIKVSNWFKANKLSLNISKTKFMIFRHEKMPKVNNFKLFIDNIEIERIGNDYGTKSFKFVGISLDELLNWNQHINNVNNKISSALYALNQVKKILPMKTLKTIYNSILQPHLQYSVITWGNAKLKDLEPLILKQKKAVRLVSKSKYNAHCEPLFSQLNILKLQDIFHLSVSSFISKFLNNQLPDSFNEIFTPLNSSRVKQLRSQIPKMKSLERFPNVTFPKIFNKLNDNIRNCTSFKSTKAKMKKSILNCYSSFKCTKRKCYPCKK